MRGNRTDLPRYDAAFDVALDGAGGEFITIPDAHLLFSGDFKRNGDSLKITGDDGKSVVIPDYFKSDRLATLLAPDGAALSGDIVVALAGPLAPGQYAQAGAPVGAAQEIGRVATLQGGAVAIRNGVTVSLNVGDVVLKGDVVQTQGSSALGIIFADGTTFNMTANARMVLNEFVYNPAGATNSALINLVQGSFTFIAGEVAKTGDMKVGTPVATMGIRGTAVQVDINLTDGTTRMSLLVEPADVALGLPERTGTFFVYSHAGNLLGTFNNAGVVVLASAISPLNATLTETPKTQAEIQQALVIVQQVVQTQAVGQAILAAQPIAPITVPTPETPIPNTPPANQDTAPPPANRDVVKTQITTQSSTTVTVTVAANSTSNAPRVVAVQVNTPTDLPTTVPVSTVLATPPVLTDTIHQQFSPEDALWTFSVPANTFVVNGVLSYVARLADGGPLPSWLTFNAATQTFSGKPPQDYFGAIELEVTGTANGLSTSFLFTLNITPVNDVPTIEVAAGNHAGSVTEDADGADAGTAPDATQATAGTITFKDVDLTDTHTASFVLKSANATADLPGYPESGALNPIGTFAISAVTEDPADAVNTGSLGWSFTLDNADPVLQSLAAGQVLTQVYTVTITDNSGATVAQDITVRITGVNDGPVIISGAAAHAGSVTEDADGPDAGTAPDATQAAAGTIAFRDLDLIDTHTASFVLKSSDVAANLPGFAEGVGAAVARIGTFAIGAVTESASDTLNTGSLGWSFTLDNADPVLQSLAAGQVLTQVYTVTITDNSGATVAQDITVRITGMNDGPVIISGAAAHAGSVTEDADGPDAGTAPDATQAAAGTIAFQDLDLINTHTASFVLKSSDAAANLPGFAEGVGAAVARIGTFAIGAVTESASDTVNTGSLGWTFTLDNNNPVLQSLAAGQVITQVYTVTITDNSGATVAQDITIRITGVNDGPVVISGAAAHAGSLTEDADGPDAGTAPDATQAAAGTIAFRDLDLIDTHTASFVLKSSDAAANLPGFAEGVGAAVARIGTFVIGAVTESASDTVNTGSLGWSFTLDNNNPVLQSLAVGQVITQVYTVTITDNSGATVAQDITIRITGVNDGPVVISGAAAHAGSLTEDADGPDAGTAPDAVQEASGTITFRDLDLIDTHTASFVLKSSDAGTVDLPGFAEGVGATVANIGTFAIDPSVTESSTDTVNNGSLGWSFTLDNNNPVLQSLAVGQVITQVYTVTIVDNTGAAMSQDITITITGTNDDPTIESAAGDHAGSVTEDADGPDADTAPDAVQEASGTITFRDLDLIDTHTASFVLKSSDAGTVDLPGFAEGVGATVANIGTFAIDPSVTESSTDTVNNGSLGWSFTLDNNNPVLQSLAVGQVITQVYTVTIVDNTGAAMSQDITITITGTNDDPVITSLAADHAGAVTEDTGAVSGELVASDTITFQDLDLINTHTAGFVLASTSATDDLPGYAEGTSGVTPIGTFALGALANANTDTTDTATLGWTFTLHNDDPVLQSLALGQVITQVYTVTITDNSGASVPQDVTITITGTNDGPVITSAAGGGEVTEDADGGDGDSDPDASQVASGTIAFQDIDLVDTHTRSFVLASTSATDDLPGYAEGTSGVTPIGTFALGALANANTDTTDTASLGWSFTLANDDPVLQSLAVGQVITQVYMVTITDNNNAAVSQDVTITITGTNDAPVIAADTPHHVTEGSGRNQPDSVVIATSGTLAFTDVDLIDTHSVTGAVLQGDSADWSAGGVIPSETLTALGTALTASIATGVGAGGAPNNFDSIGTGAGQIAWDFSVPDHLLDFLAQGETLTLVYDITVDDGHGGTHTQQVTIVVHGTQDGPFITAADEDGALIEGFVLSDTGSIALSFTELDVTDTLTASHNALTDATIVWSGGTLSQAQGSALRAGFTLDQTTFEDSGALNWTYARSESDLDFLAEGETVIFTVTVTVTDTQGESDSRNIVITITGTNDDPTISAADQSGSLTEGSVLSDSGDISFVELDQTDTLTVTHDAADTASIEWSGGSLTPVQEAMLRGGFTLNQSAFADSGTVTWTYARTESELDFLAAGETVTLEVTVTVSDDNVPPTSDSRLVTITITGTNDDPTISAADQSGSLAEGSVLSDSGAISFVELDQTDTLTVTHDAADTASIEWSGGSLTPVQEAMLRGGFTLNQSAFADSGTVTWTYARTEGQLDFLAAGETVELVVRVTVTDSEGTSDFRDVVITITGTNDAPVVNAIAQRDLDEQTDTCALTATIAVTFTDVDLTDVGHSATVTAAAATNTTAGLALDEAALMALVTPGTVTKDNGSTAGSVDLAFAAASTAFDYLADCEVVTLTYTVAIDDADGGVTPQTFVVTITGTNDAPVVNAIAQQDLDEQTGTCALTATIAVTFTDVDLTDTGHTATITAAVASGVITGLVLDEVALMALVTPGPVTKDSGSTAGSVDLAFAAASTAFDYLADCEVVTLTYTVAINDADGGVTPQTFVVTITGTNDAPVVNAIAQQDLDEQTDTCALTATIAVTFTDVDLTDTGHTATITAAVASGVITGLVLDEVALMALVTPGPVTKDSGSTAGSVDLAFAAASTAFDYLADCEVVTLTYTVAINDADGGVTPQTFVVAITGTNDAPVVNAIAQRDLDEQTDTCALTATIAVTFSDVDLTDVGHSATVTAAAATGVIAGLGLDETALIALVTPGPVTKDSGSTAGSVDLAFAAASTAFDYLADCEVVTLTYTVAIDDADGGVTPQTFVVAITGTNDAPVVNAIAQQDLDEQTGTCALTATIAVTFSDVDLTDVGHSATVTTAAATGVIAGLGLDETALIALVTPGPVTKDSGSTAGSVDLAFAAASTAFDYLADCEVVTLTYTVAIDDADGGVTPQTFVVTITGTNDAPVVAAIAQQDLNEQTDTCALTATIAVTFTDVDLTDTGHTATITAAVASGVITGLVLDEVALMALVTPGPVTKDSGSTAGSVDLAFAAASTAFDYLADCEVVTLTYTVAINDLDGGMTPQTFVVAITGTNDAPVAVSETLGGDLAGFTYNSDNGHWYKVNSSTMSWANAQAAAVVAGGYLASITSLNENTFVKDLVNTAGLAYAWIGASDNAVEGEWRWVGGPDDGELFWTGGFAPGGGGFPYSYAAWESGVEPNGASGENFAYIRNTGPWVDYTGDGAGGAGHDPLASVIEVSFVEDTVSVIPSAFLLANDTDVDSGAPTINGLGVSNLSTAATAAGGAVELLGNGNIQYTPNANFSGMDSFTYTVKDSSGAVSNSATATFFVSPGTYLSNTLTFDDLLPSNAISTGYGDWGPFDGFNFAGATAATNPDDAMAPSIGMKIVGGATSSITSVDGTEFTLAALRVDDLFEGGCVQTSFSSVEIVGFNGSERVWSETFTNLDQLLSGFNGTPITSVAFVGNVGGFGTVDNLVYTTVPSVRGTASADELYATPLGNRVIGYAGNDTLHGNTGADTFVFHPGSDDDLIVGFNVSVDRIELFDPDIGSYQDLLDCESINFANGDTQIVHGNGDVITVQSAVLTASNFIFHQTTNLVA